MNFQNSPLQKIFAISWKDALIRFSSASELLFFIVLPLFFTFLLAGGTPSGDADSRILVLVVDEAQTTLSVEVIASLERSTAVQPRLVSQEEAEESFDERTVSAVLVIPAGFDLAALASGESQLDLRMQPNSLNAQVVQRALQTISRQVGSAVEIARLSVEEAERLRPFASEADRQAYYQQAFQAAQEQVKNMPQRVQVVRGSTPDQVEYDPAANSSAGQLITWVFIPLLGISAMYAFERQQGTLRRLLVTPTAKATFILGTITGQVAVAVVQVALLVAFGVYVMKLGWGRDLPALAVILFSFILAGAAMGTMLGAFVKTDGQANGLSIMLGMVMALLGGCWYPIELFPEFVRTAVKVLPTSWAMQGMLDLVLRGKGLVDVLPEAGVLLGFAAIFFVVGAARFRFE